jgi:hypothetical protein
LDDCIIIIIFAISFDDAVIVNKGVRAMKRTQKIGSFHVEIYPSTRSGKVLWTAYLPEQPNARAEANTYDAALYALSGQWIALEAAYLAAGQPVPTRKRRRGNKRILDTIDWLAKQEITPIF